MNSLHELQCQLRDALLRNDATLVDTQIRDDGLPVVNRLNIYRNTVFTNLREALRTMFPVINKLVGEDFFAYAADEYIRRYPSPAGDLNQFGEHLAAFFAEFELASTLPYLSDVAKLEWLAHKVYHASMHSGLAIDQLGTVDPALYGELHFSLNSTSALLHSEYPIQRIWQVNQPNYEGDPVVDLNAGGVSLLIERRASLIELQSLSIGEWLLLTTLAADKDFSTACHHALLAEPDLDLSSTLMKLVAQATLVDFRIHDKEEIQ
jgi:hypothetical protein